jgi:hypothetical protein
MIDALPVVAVAPGLSGLPEPAGGDAAPGFAALLATAVTSPAPVIADTGLAAPLPALSALALLADAGSPPVPAPAPHPAAAEKAGADTAETADTADDAARAAEVASDSDEPVPVVVVALPPSPMPLAIPLPAPPPAPSPLPPPLPPSVPSAEPEFRRGMPSPPRAPAAGAPLPVMSALPLSGAAINPTIPAGVATAFTLPAPPRAGPGIPALSAATPAAAPAAAPAGLAIGRLPAAAALPPGVLPLQPAALPAPPAPTLPAPPAPTLPAPPVPTLPTLPAPPPRPRLPRSEEPLPDAVALARAPAPALPDRAPAIAADAPPRPIAAPPPLSIASDALGSVSVGIDGGPQDLHLRFDANPLAAGLLLAEAPRLVADLAAHGVRLQSLDIGGQSLNPSFGQQPGQQHQPPPGLHRPAIVSAAFATAPVRRASATPPSDRFA